MPVALKEPVLTLAIDSLSKLTSINDDDISVMWLAITKSKHCLQNGPRLENLSWRLWYRSSHPSGAETDGTASELIPPMQPVGLQLDAGLALSSSKLSIDNPIVVQEAPKPTIFTQVAGTSPANHQVSPSSFNKLLSNVDQSNQLTSFKLLIDKKNKKVSSVLTTKPAPEPVVVNQYADSCVAHLPIQLRPRFMNAGQPKATFFISGCSTDSPDDIPSNLPHELPVFHQVYDDSDYSDYDDYLSERDELDTCGPSSLFEKVSVLPAMLSNSKSLSRHQIQQQIKQQEEESKQSLLSIALKRTPTGSIRQAKQGMMHHPYQRFNPPTTSPGSYMQHELSDSLRQNLAWDRAMPFNTKLTRHGPLPNASINSDTFGHNYW